MPASPPVYLDWNATTPLHPRAADAMAEAMAALGPVGLNPSSQHGPGRSARSRVEAARNAVAGLVGAAPIETLFTGSASEAAATVFAQGWDTVLVSAIEHDCVRGAAAMAEETGARLVTLGVGDDGVVRASTVAAALAETSGSDRRLVAVMAANNETGALQPVGDIVAEARAAGAETFVDATQAVGKTSFDFQAVGADAAILSAHKIGGPSGVGALLLRDGSPLAQRFRPLVPGGGQEMRRRAGTENLLGVVGFGAAADAAATTEARAAWMGAAERRDRFEAALKSEVAGLVFFGDRVDRVATTTCVALAQARAEFQLMALDLEGFAVSAGSACSSGKMGPSHVLTAMGADAETAASAIRVSFGPDTPWSDLQRFVAAYGRMAARRRR